MSDFSLRAHALVERISADPFDPGVEDELDALRGVWRSLPDDERALGADAARALAEVSRARPAPRRSSRVRDEQAEAQMALSGLDRIEVGEVAERRYEGPRDPDALLALVWAVDSFRPGQAETVAAALARARQPCGDADRRRQEPLLPAARDRIRRVDGHRVAADRADGRSVPAARARRPPGRDDRVGDGRGRSRAGARGRPGRPRPDRDVLARALRFDLVPARRSRSGPSTCSRSTRRTACPSGVTTSAPTTCGCAA